MEHFAVQLQVLQKSKLKETKNIKKRIHFVAIYYEHILYIKKELFSIRRLKLQRDRTIIEKTFFFELKTFFRIYHTERKIV